ncbi:MULTISPECIES: 16S rRNA (uracil(1498)-N(3))-methyltransferase [Prochlorococcus]|uniref:16S rRNA (uracil(1498)-N(3))-methyltransferase n=1 Tax=Prochlorococcus TaxID=1218 RepID=UPI0005337515|nr:MULTISPECIES: 16S rRNA (uracil(1498)-N(3))-methyltransferase [Prochlorococcus]KGG12562.1 Ribosomal RNA small subunit methyltransferase E [Prochlorococcus sp. MIT 0601]
MAEYRRLLIDQRRLDLLDEENPFLLLTKKELHYLARVIRLRKGDEIFIVDGKGNLWKACFLQSAVLKILSSYKSPEQTQKRILPLLSLAVVVPKNGFEEVLKMGTEIGIDIFQPLTSQRGCVKRIGSSKFSRWESIISEAVEQSERLWKPELRTPIEFQDWIDHISKLNSSLSLGITRIDEYVEFESWLKTTPRDNSDVWIIIGPEGGWSEDELRLAGRKGCSNVQLGQSILRTSTAAVSASQLMASWRRFNH